ncbi:MAG: hypothetical protein ACM3JD_07345 [Rudaea sp.]
MIWQALGRVCTDADARDVATAKTSLSVTVVTAAQAGRRYFATMEFADGGDHAQQDYQRLVTATE